MKYVLLVTALAFSLCLSAQEMQIPETQRLLISKRTATWCPHCGTWGWSLFSDLLADHAGQAELWSVHYSGDLMNPTAEKIAENLGGQSQPRFYVGHTDQNVTSGTAAAARTAIADQVDAAAGQSPLAQTGIIVADEGSYLDIRTTTRFFSAAEGEFFLAVYVVQKSVIANQAGHGSSSDHKLVLADRATAEWYGEMLGEGTIAAGTEREINVNFSLQGYDPENLRIVTVIWKREGDRYLFVNTNGTDEMVEGPLAVGEYEVPKGQIIVRTNPIRHHLLQLTVVNVPLMEQGRLLLVSMDGRYYGSLAGAGELFDGQPCTFPLDPNMPAGSYVLMLETPAGTWLQPILVN